MPRLSTSNRANGASPAHAWLAERVYAPKRERTTELVKQSVDALVVQGERVSLASIAATSKAVDPEGQGVSESAILGNAQARAYYKQHRSWKGTPRKRAAATAPSFHPEHIKPDRDRAHARQRYMQMSKTALVDRLLAVEQEYAERQERWLVQQDELLQWRLRAEQAEARLQREKAAKTRARR